MLEFLRPRRRGVVLSLILSSLAIVGTVAIPLLLVNVNVAVCDPVDKLTMPRMDSHAGLPSVGPLGTCGKFTSETVTEASIPLTIVHDGATG